MLPSKRSQLSQPARWRLPPCPPGALLAGGAVLLTLVVSLTVPYFATLNNVMGLLSQAAIVAIAALGLTLVIFTGGIDLSIGGVMSLAGLVDVLLIRAGMPWVLALAVGVVLGLAIGAGNGMLVAHLRVPSFVASFGTLGISAGAALFIADGLPGTRLPAAMIAFGNRSLWSVPYLVILAVVLLTGLQIVLHLTPWGSNLRSTGDDPHVARLAGVPVAGTLLGAYMLSGGMAALAGGALTARLSTAGPLQGEPYTLAAIAACVVGGIDLMGGKGHLWAGCLGAIFLAAIRNVMNLQGIQPFIQDLVTGLLIIVAVFFSTRAQEFISSFVATFAAAFSAAFAAVQRLRAKKEVS